MTAVDSPADGGLEILSITPEPTDAERAAIVAAVDALGGRLLLQLDAAPVPAPSPRWRYASRPWKGRQSYAGWR